MKTTIYWAVQHIRRAALEFRFRAMCWWLSQQAEFLEWCLRLEALMPVMPSEPAPAQARQGGHYAVRTM